MSRELDDALLTSDQTIARMSLVDANRPSKHPISSYKNEKKDNAFLVRFNLQWLPLYTFYQFHDISKRIAFLNNHRASNAKDAVGHH